MESPPRLADAEPMRSHRIAALAVFGTRLHDMLVVTNELPAADSAGRNLQVKLSQSAGSCSSQLLFVGLEFVLDVVS